MLKSNGQVWKPFCVDDVEILIQTECTSALTAESPHCNWRLHMAMLFHCLCFPYLSVVSMPSDLVTSTGFLLFFPSRWPTSWSLPLRHSVYSGPVILCTQFPSQWNCPSTSMEKNTHILYRLLQCNAMQCNAMQCNAMQCNAMQCNAMQCNAMQCNAMQCKATLRYATLRYTTLHYNTIQYNTIQYNTIQYNTIQYNTLTFYCPGPGNSFYSIRHKNIKYSSREV